MKRWFMPGMILLIAAALVACADLASGSLGENTTPTTGTPSESNTNGNDNFPTAQLFLADLAKPFEIKMGETYTVPDAGLRITFVQVSQDSRCPQGVQCIRAGDATAVFDVEPKHGEPQTISFTFLDKPVQQKVGENTISFIKLEPVPTAKNPQPDQSKYVATIEVTGPQVVIVNDNQKTYEPPAEISGTLQIRIGDSVTYPSADLPDPHIKIKFVDVTEDSRCPTTVECFWEGQIVIALNVETSDNGEDQLISLTLRGKNSEPVTVRDFQITLIDVDPYPAEATSIPHDAYVATLQIVKQ